MDGRGERQHLAEAVRPGAVVSAVARRHDMSPQHLFRWIRAVKDGDFALPENEAPSFVPVVVEPSRRGKTVAGERSVAIEIAIGAIKVRVCHGADARTVAAVLRAVKWAAV
jgi:transposase